MKQPDEPADNQSEKVGEQVAIFLRGNKWYANFQDKGHQVRKALKTTSKKEARRKAIQLEAKLASNSYEASPKNVPVAFVIAKYREYLVAEGRSKKTMAKYNYAFGLIEGIAAARRVRSVREIDHSFVDAFRAMRANGGAARKTIHTDSVILRQVVNFALQRNLIREDPLRGYKLSRPKNTSQPFWSKETMEIIIAAAAEPQRSIFRVLAETGMRIGELKHLTPSDLDFENGVVHIRGKEGWRPKSGDTRVVPMSPTVRDVLAMRPKKAKWAFTSVPTPKYPGTDRQVSERSLLQYLKRILKRLKLPGHLHTFRHSFISVALTSGVAEAVVRDWVGHVDHEIMKRYTHIASGISKAAMKHLAAAMGSPGSNQE